MWPLCCFSCYPCFLLLFEMLVAEIAHNQKFLNDLHRKLGWPSISFLTFWKLGLLSINTHHLSSTTLDSFAPSINSAIDSLPSIFQKAGFVWLGLQEKYGKGMFCEFEKGLYTLVKWWGCKNYGVVKERYKSIREGQEMGGQDFVGKKSRERKQKTDTQRKMAWL